MADNCDDIFGVPDSALADFTLDGLTPDDSALGDSAPGGSAPDGSAPGGSEGGGESGQIELYANPILSGSVWAAGEGAAGAPDIYLPALDAFSAHGASYRTALRGGFAYHPMAPGRYSDGLIVAERLVIAEDEDETTEAPVVVARCRCENPGGVCLGLTAVQQGDLEQAEADGLVAVIQRAPPRGSALASMLFALVRYHARRGFRRAGALAFLFPPCFDTSQPFEAQLAEISAALGASARADDCTTLLYIALAAQKKFKAWQRLDGGQKAVTVYQLNGHQAKNRYEAWKTDDGRLFVCSNFTDYATVAQAGARASGGLHEFTHPKIKEAFEWIVGGGDAARK